MVEVLPFPDYSPENITKYYGDGLTYEQTERPAPTERPNVRAVNAATPSRISTAELSITNREMVEYANNISTRIDLLRAEAAKPNVAPVRRSLLSRPAKPLHILSMREIINRESAQGATLFEKPTKGERVEFFYLGEGAWIWHKEGKDAAGKPEIITTRYEVKDGAVVKAQDGTKRSYIGDAQLHNLALWMFNYYELVARNVYNREPGSHRSLDEQQAA